MELRRAEGGGARGEGNLNGPLGALVGWLVGEIGSYAKFTRVGCSAN